VAWVDLQHEPPRLRKSFKSLVNWGKRNLRIDRANGRQFDDFREFHAHVADRVTRPKPSWDLCFDEVRAGRGALLLGYLNDALVSGALFIDGDRISVYWSAVADRTLDLPLAHALIAEGINLAAERHMSWLELGEVPAVGTADDKEVAIGFFKSGFASHILPADISPFHEDIERWRRR
jgi:hypothetical protein